MFPRLDEKWKLAFNVFLKIIAFDSYPVDDVSLSVRWRLHSDSSVVGHTTKGGVEKGSHHCVWNENFVLRNVKFYVGMKDCLLRPACIDMAVFEENDNVDDENSAVRSLVGSTCIDLSWFVDARMMPRKSKILLKKCPFNAMLTFSIKMVQISGTPLYKLPDQKSSGQSSIGACGEIYKEPGLDPYLFELLVTEAPRQKLQYKLSMEASTTTSTLRNRFSDLTVHDSTHSVVNNILSQGDTNHDDEDKNEGNNDNDNATGTLNAFGVKPSARHHEEAGHTVQRRESRNQLWMSMLYQGASR